MTASEREVVALVGTGRGAAPLWWHAGPALTGRGGDVDWICGDCGATVLSRLRRPETLVTVEVRCPQCRHYQRPA